MSDQHLPATPATAPQFESAAQQRDAVTFGMWIFLASEMLLFGALFLGYTVYRLGHPEAFGEASRHTLLIPGTLNTAILILSSATMAFAVEASRNGRKTATVIMLIVTAVLGAAFLGIKAYEYHREISEHLLPGRSFRFDPRHAGSAEMFFYLYFLITGIHSLHVLMGVVLISFFAFRAGRAGPGSQGGFAVTALGLYWHFVDVVWVFLFPLIYLVNRHP